MTHVTRIEVVERSSLAALTLDAVVALCVRAYDEPFDELMRQFADATHVLGYVDHELVSHALWVPRLLHAGGVPLHAAYVEAVATEPAHQRRGHATSVLRALADAIHDYDIGALSPSDPAFYARIGWESWRGPLAVATASGEQPEPDDVMILRLPRTPPIDLDSRLVAPWREGDIW
jgi:aminoglycoside 2'-N-acetyltransferase I